MVTRNLRRNGLFAFLLLSMLAGLGSGRSSAASTRVSLAPFRGAGAATGLPTETAIASDGRRAYIVVFRDEPLVRSIAASLPGVSRPLRSAAPADVEKKARQISQKQDAFEADMRRSISGFQAGTRYSHALNGMAVLVPAGAVSILRSDPRVKAVYPVRKYQLHLDASNPLMNAPTFWGSVGGDANAGAGVKFADIDTGVDFSNPMFSDPSLVPPAGFPKDDGEHLANSKVIVAKYFQGIVDQTDPTLNAGHRTAQDLSGHGSHTASVAAGAKVALSGAGQRPVTLEGVAPKAYIGDYRVFCPNAFDDNIIAAIDEAVADGMDVINMSFGLNNQDGTEPFLFNNAAEYEAIENAITAGVVVTVSAGNAGQDSSGNPLPGSISSTADVPDVIAVGASTNTHDGVSASLLAKVAMTSSSAPSDLKNIIGAQGVGTGITFPTSTSTAAFTDWSSFDGGGGGLACSAIPPAHVTGTIVLIQRGTCTFSTKVQNAATAGAVGVVIYNSVAGGDALLIPSVDGTTIPTIFVKRSDGLNLKTYLDANPNPPASDGTFGPAPPGTPAATFDTAGHDLADFSSLGPTIDFQIKPDLTSVGVGSYAACQNDSLLGEGRFPVPDSDAGQDIPIYDPSGFTFGDGTSFSAPRAAGSAALMLQKHPGWTPAEIKAALMETAARPTDPNDPLKVGNLSVMQRGSGDIDLAAASAVNSIVLPASHSFRQVFLNGAPPAGFLTRTFILENKGTTPATYQIAAAATAGLTDPAVVPSVSPSTLALAPATSGTFTLTLNVGAGLLVGQHDSEGAITVSDGGTTGSLYVPYWVRIQNQNGTPPLLETASAAIDPVTANEVNIDLTAHDNEGDIDSFSVLFLDSTGQPVAFASDTFGGSLDGQKDVTEELQITGVTPSVCPDCVAVSVQLFDAKGFASNILQARYKPAAIQAVPSSTGTDFRRVVPLVANTQGSGFFFQSDARIFNPSTSHPVTINAYLVSQGQNGTSSALHATHVVFPRESLALNDLCLTDFDAPGSIGSLVLDASDGSTFLASSRAYERSGGGTFGTFVPTETPAGAVGQADGTVTANGFETAAGFHTNVGATEVSGVETLVKIEGFDLTGVSVGSFTLDLLPYSNQQYNPLADATHQFTAPAARVDFTVLSGGRVIPYGATVDEGSGDTLLSIAKPQPESSDDLFITLVAHTHGANNSFLTSDLSVTNLSSGDRIFTITLLPDFLGGTPSTPAPITVHAGQTLVVRDVLQSLFGLTGDSGAGLRIHPDAPAALVVSARTSTPNTATGGTGTYGFFVTAEKASDALFLGGKKVSIHLAQNAEFRTNFGFTEVAGAQLTVRATFFDENGTQQGTKAYPLPANQAIQTNLSDLIGAGSFANGYIEFTVDSGSGAALPFAAGIDNATNDLVYVPGESE